MEKHRLSNNDLKLLFLLNLSANMPVRELRAKTGLQEHTIRYSLLGMQSRKFIQKVPIINVYRLGLTEQSVLLSLNPIKGKVHSELRKYLISSEHVSSLLELGGEFHYELIVCGRNLAEIGTFYEQLVTRFGNIFATKVISTRRRYNQFRYKALLGPKQPEPSLSIGGRGFHEKIDDLDHYILSSLSNRGHISALELAKNRDVPSSTVDYRLRRLEERQIIAGYIYLIDTPRLGYQPFKLLVYTGGFGVGLSHKLEHYCRKNPYISFLQENLGQWDYEIGLECDNPSLTVTQIRQDLFEQFGSEIGRIDVLPVFSRLKISTYPLSFSELAR